MIGLILLLTALLVGLGYFLIKNQQDKRNLEKLLQDTLPEDEAHDRTHVF